MNKVYDQLITFARDCLGCIVFENPNGTEVTLKLGTNKYQIKKVVEDKEVFE